MDASKVWLLTAVERHLSRSCRLSRPKSPCMHAPRMLLDSKVPGPACQHICPSPVLQAGAGRLAAPHSRLDHPAPPQLGRPACRAKPRLRGAASTARRFLLGPGAVLSAKKWRGAANAVRSQQGALGSGARNLACGQAAHNCSPAWSIYYIARFFCVAL